MLSLRKFIVAIGAITASLYVTGMVLAIETAKVAPNSTHAQSQENTPDSPRYRPFMNKPPHKSFCKDLFTSTCMLTGLTNPAAHITGVRYFLPQLTTLRFANMGRIDPDVFGRQLKELKSFKETEWCPYWNAFAQNYEVEAQKRLAANGGKPDQSVQDALIKATTYYSVSAWPGTTPLRLEAYARARDLSDQLAPMMDPNLQKVALLIAGEKVTGYLHLPAGAGRYPVVIVTNGLEGTMQELAFPLMKYRDEKIGVFIMEMPGTYAYKQPMSTASEAVYHGVIDYVAAQPRVDPGRIAMVGVSFGGYWSARMAALSPRLCCAVVCGAPLQHAFTISNSFGLPAIMVSTLEKVVGASSLLDLRTKMEALSFAKDDLYQQIKIPLLIINGDTDTLVGTQDSIALNRKVPNAFLKLYENDDHCAMVHYDQWLDLTFMWLKMQFTQTKGT